MYYEILKVIDVIKPPVVLLENVKNLVEHDNGRTFITIYSTLAECVQISHKRRHRERKCGDPANNFSGFRVKSIRFSTGLLRRKLLAMTVNRVFRVIFL